MLLRDPILPRAELEIDDLTRVLLELVRGPDESLRMRECLVAFFRNARSRLNELKLGLYVARRSADVSRDAEWAAINRSYRELEHLINTVERVCSPLPVEFEATNLDLLLAQLRPSWDQRIAAGDRALLWLPPDQPLITICDPRLLAEGLDLLVAWRAEESARGATIRVAWWNESGTTHLLWEEATRPDQPLGLPTPLSVPILVRILAAHRGAVHVSRHTGVQIELEWPTDPRTPSHPASSDLSA